MQTETSRIEAFSDGMFAIAITLLILEVKVPGPAAGHLAAALLKQWPSYLAFLLSFLYIGVMWMNHHRMFTHIRRSNDTLLVLNLLLLLGVTAVPFPTAVLAAHLGTADQKTCGSVLQRRLSRHRYLFQRTLALRRFPAIGRQESVVIGSDDLATICGGTADICPLPALAFVDVRVSLGMNVALAIYFALPPSMLRKSS